MEAYRFEDSRAGECVARYLNGYRVILQVDGLCRLQQVGPLRWRQ